MTPVAIAKLVVAAAALLFAVKPVQEANARNHHEHKFPGMPFNPWTPELAKETLLHSLPAGSLAVANYAAMRLSAPPTAEMEMYAEDAFLNLLSDSWDNTGAEPAAEAAAVEEEAAEGAVTPKQALRKAGKEIWRLCAGFQNGQEPKPVHVMNCVVKGVLLLHAAKPVMDARAAEHHEHKYPGMPFNPWTSALAKKTLLHAVPEGAWWAGEALAKELHNKHRAPLGMPGAKAAAAPAAAAELAPATEEEVQTATQEDVEVHAPVEHWSWLVGGVGAGWLAMCAVARFRRKQSARA